MSHYCPERERTIPMDKDGCSLCSPAVSRSGEEAARAWLEAEWPNLHPDLEKWRGFITNMLLPLHTAHVRKQERQATLKLAIKSLCPNCTRQHVLDNGRVWGFCGAQRLIGKHFTEDDIAAAIREGE